MKKEDLIALGLTEEQADKVVEGYGQMVPKTRLDDKIKEVKDLSTQISDRDKQLEELKPKAAGNEALLEQIQKLQDDAKVALEAYEKKTQEQSYNFALDSALSGAKVKNVKAIKALLDSEKIKLDGDKLSGLDEQLVALKTSDAYLFDVEQQQQQPPTFTPPGNPTPPGGKNEPSTLAEALAQRFETK